jgi:hypothetical protein
MYVACIFDFRARRENPNIFCQDCAPSLHHCNGPWYIVSSGAPRKNMCQAVRAMAVLWWLKTDFSKVSHP